MSWKESESGYCDVRQDSMASELMRSVRDEDDHNTANAHAEELVRERKQIRLANTGICPPLRIVSRRELRTHIHTRDR